MKKLLFGSLAVVALIATGCSMGASADGHGSKCSSGKCGGDKKAESKCGSK